MKNAKHVIPLLKKVSATDIFFITLADEQIDVRSRNNAILHQLKLNYNIKLTARDVRNIVAGTIIAYPDASGAFIGQLTSLFREQWGISRELDVAHGSLTGTMKALAILEPSSQDQMLVQSIELWKEDLGRHADWAQLSDELSGELSNDLGKYLGGLGDHGKVFRPFLSFLRNSYERSTSAMPLLDQVAKTFIFGVFSEFSTITRLELLEKALG